MALTRTTAGHRYNHEFEITDITSLTQYAELGTPSYTVTGGVLQARGSGGPGWRGVLHRAEVVDLVTATRWLATNIAGTTRLFCLVRYAQDTDWYAWMHRTDVGNAQLHKSVASAFTSLGTAQAFTYANSIYYRSRMHVKGSTLKGRINATSDSVTDTSLTTQTRGGVKMWEDADNQGFDFDYIRMYTDQLITVTGLAENNFVELLAKGSPWNPDSTEDAVVASATVGVGQTSVTLDISTINDHPPFKNLKVWTSDTKTTLRDELAAADQPEASVTTHTVAGEAKGVWGGSAWNLGSTTAYLDRTGSLNVAAQAILDRNASLNVVAQAFLDRPMSVDIQPFATQYVNRPVSLNVADTVYLDRTASLNVVLNSFLDRVINMNLVAQGYLDRQASLNLFAPSFADRNLSLEIMPIEPMYGNFLFPRASAVEEDNEHLFVQRAIPKRGVAYREGMGSMGRRWVIRGFIQESNPVATMTTMRNLADDVPRIFWTGLEKITGCIMQKPRFPRGAEKLNYVPYEVVIAEQDNPT